MKALGFGLLLAITTLSSSHAQRSPDSLPAVTVDCYQSFAAKAALPELASREVVVDGGNSETPLIRYRHQVVAWREELSGGAVRLFTFDFEDLLLSTVDISPARSSAAGVELHVMKCSKSA